MASATNVRNHKTGNRDPELGNWYSICGLPVRSEIALPLPLSLSAPKEPPTWTVRYGDSATRLTKPDWHWPTGSTVGRPLAKATSQDKTVFYQHYQQGADGLWFWWDQLATIHVSADARLVEVFLDPDPDVALLGSLLAGPLAAVVLGRLGFAILHASAVGTAVGAVAFLGRKGQGKSTMAAAFLQNGGALLTDDMLMLRAGADGVYGVPGPPIMRLWKLTVEHTLGLSASDLPDVGTNLEKKVLWIDGRYSMVQEPMRLVAVYVLDRYEPSPGQSHPISTRELFGTASLTALLAQTYRPVESAQPVASLIPTLARLAKQGPVRTLHYPTGFEWQKAACELVLQEVGG